MRMRMYHTVSRRDLRPPSRIWTMHSNISRSTWVSMHCEHALHIAVHVTQPAAMLFMLTFLFWNRRESAQVRFPLHACKKGILRSCVGAVAWVHMFQMNGDLYACITLLSLVLIQSTM